MFLPSAETEIIFFSHNHLKFNYYTVNPEFRNFSNTYYFNCYEGPVKFTNNCEIVLAIYIAESSSKP